MGDRDSGGLPPLGARGDDLLCPVVQGTGCFVENQNSGIGYQRASDQQPLALTTRQAERFRFCGSSLSTQFTGFSRRSGVLGPCLSTGSHW